MTKRRILVVGTAVSHLARLGDFINTAAYADEYYYLTRNAFDPPKPKEKFTGKKAYFQSPLHKENVAAAMRRGRRGNHLLPTRPRR